MSGPDAMAPPEATTSNAMRWAIIILLAVGALIAFVDRTSISAAIASKPFKEHFHLTDLGRGWLNSAFFWSYALLQIPMGVIVDRYGVKWPYAISFVIWCVASMLTALTTALAGLIVARVSSSAAVLFFAAAVSVAALTATFAPGIRHMQPLEEVAPA